MLKKHRQMTTQKYKTGFALILFALALLLINTSLVQAEDIKVTVKSLDELIYKPVKKIPAQVIALQESQLSSEVSALVDDISVDVGDHVSNEQLLVTLNCDDYQFILQQTEAEHQAIIAERDFATYQLKRSYKLLKSKSISQESHRQLLMQSQKADAQVKLLKSKIEQAKLNVSRCHIKAPYAGVIVQRMINIGESLNQGTPVLRLMNLNKLEVEAQTPIVMVDKLAINSLHFIFQGQRYPLSVKSIVPSIESRARHQRVRLSFIQQVAPPNAFGELEVLLNETYIPANYLVKRNNSVGLFILDQSSKERYSVRFYAISDALIGRAAKVELPLDTQIIVSGRQALNDGQSVIITSDSGKK